MNRTRLTNVTQGRHCIDGVSLASLCCLLAWLARMLSIHTFLDLPTCASGSRKMETGKSPQRMFSSWRFAFSLCRLLGIFPVQMDKAQETFQFKYKLALLSGFFWTAAFSAAVYTQLHFILDIDVIGGANIVGCQQNVTRGPDLIYNILSSLYFVYDFFILVSGLIFAKHMASSLSRFSVLIEDFAYLNKEVPEASPMIRPCFVNLLPILAQLIWQILFHLKRSCLQNEFPSPQGILASLLYILIDLRSYLGILVFYDSLFLFTKNTLLSCVAITLRSKNTENILDNCNLIEQLLVQLQDAFSYFLLVHISLLVLFSTLNTYFAIICLRVGKIHFCDFYRTRVRSLFTLVTN